MALFILTFLFINYCFTNLSGFESRTDTLLEIKPSTITAGQKVGFYKVEGTLNLTCIFRNESILSDVILEWIIPSKSSSSQNRVINKPGTNYAILTIENLQEKDSGDYKCRVIHNGIPYLNLESLIKINVKNKKKECTEAMFQCSAGICIPKRYTCDGLVDCTHGEDESSSHCGSGNPCDNKLMCPDSRCIPFTWCCESHREPNCTTKVKHNCCTHVEKLTRDVDSDLGFQYEQQRFSGIGFLQTTVYTVIGCAMAFMFIVTTIVIAICRVHVRRSLLSRCPAANRNLVLGRGGNIHGNQLNGLSFLDLYFNRSGLHGNDLMSVNPLLVTYNINNGVQFVGRPVDPPPYCEIVTSPPKEGPPPPYASRENLSEVRLCGTTEESKSHSGRDSESNGDVEETESEALLSATRQNIRFICSNAFDVPPSEGTGENFNSQEGSIKRKTKNPETASKSTMDGSSCSSHCFVDKSVGSSKNSGLDIVVVNNCESAASENCASLKINAGESSSFGSDDVSELSKVNFQSRAGLDAYQINKMCSTNT